MPYMNQDGLLKKYGTEKAIPTLGGDFVTLGETRNAEFTINLATLTASPQVLSDVTFFMQGVFVEQVDVVDEVAAVGGTSFSVGLIGLDRTTVSSNTAFVLQGGLIVGVLAVLIYDGLSALERRLMARTGQSRRAAA